MRLPPGFHRPPKQEQEKDPTKNPLLL